MNSFELCETPEFNNSAIGSSDKPEPVGSIVKSNIKDLRGGIDGFFDTMIKVENDEISEETGLKAMNSMIKQIEEARSLLVGCGVQIPNKNVNYDTTTENERMHELGRWTYSFFEDKYDWDVRLRGI